MNVEGWIAIGGAAVSVVGWFITLERRLGARLTRQEHEEICERRNADIKSDIEQLREDMQNRHDENRETLARIDAATTGTHQRIDQLYRDFRRSGSAG